MHYCPIFVYINCLTDVITLDQKKLFISPFIPGIRNLQPTGHMHPTRVVHAASEDLQSEKEIFSKLKLETFIGNKGQNPIFPRGTFAH